MAITHPSQAPAAGNLGTIAALAAGDMLALIIFAAIGRASHGEAAGLDAIGQIIEVAAPFVAGWFLAAPMAGAYRRAAVTRPGPMLARTTLAWVIACPIGLGGRALIRQSGVPITFALVTFATVLLIMLIWRGMFALAAGRIAHHGERTGE